VGVGFLIGEIVSTHLAFGFLSGQVELVKKAGINLKRDRE
jgi:hypothetical protein